LFREDAPDGEREVEIRRSQTLLHPGCFKRLSAELRLNAPDNHLEAPKFQLPTINCLSRLVAASLPQPG